MADDSPESPQRWTAKRRASLVLSILKGETSAQAAARKHGLTVAEVEEWRDRFLLGAENALRARPKDEDTLKDEQIKKLKQKVGELLFDQRRRFPPTQHEDRDQRRHCHLQAGPPSRGNARGSRRSAGDGSSRLGVVAADNNSQ